MQDRRIKPKAKHQSRVLAEHTSTRAIVEKLKHSRWPFIPFNKVEGIEELLVVPKTHKQSIMVAKRALQALETATNPAEFAEKVRGIRSEDFSNMLENLPEELRHNPRAFYKIVKAIGDVNKVGVLVEELVINPGEANEETVSVEKGLADMIEATYCRKKSWGSEQAKQEVPLRD
jgi:hypothetical protein